MDGLRTAGYPSPSDSGGGRPSESASLRGPGSGSDCPRLAAAERSGSLTPGGGELQAVQGEGLVVTWYDEGGSDPSRWRSAGAGLSRRGPQPSGAQAAVWGSSRPVGALRLFEEHEGQNGQLGTHASPKRVRLWALFHSTHGVL